MNKRALPSLEVLSRVPVGTAHRTPLLFVHGAFCGAWAWQEHFLPYFAAQGYAAHALSLRGHGGSAGHEHIDWWSIADYVDDVQSVIADFEHKPVLIGHSMGGFVVQKLFEREHPAGAVLLASVPPQGLMSSSLSMMMAQPDLMSQINRAFDGNWAQSSVLRDAMFAQPVDSEALERYYHLMQTESQRALWDMTMFDLPRLPQRDLPPLLVLGTEHDRLIPASQAHATASFYGVSAEIVPGLGHGMMLEQDWQLIADRIIRWLVDQAI